MVLVRNIHKSFGGKEILKGIDLQADKEDVVAIIGPSGTGKTTLLRCINCLEKPDAGNVTIDGVSCESPHIPKKEMIRLRRKTAMVFQHYNLFKNMNAWENVAEGLITVHKKPRNEAKNTAFEQLALVGLEGRETAYPHELSGGQQQRVGIARALALQPKVLLFDEPTSSLDPELVGEVLAVMKTVARMGITMLVVTHEMSFAGQVANKVVYMEDGRIVEQGAPRDIFTHPKEKETQRFLEKTIRPFVYEI
ncbi:arginine ABC transporter ATP-binding protein [Spirochaetia bacterium]|nr:arginine ABC transporter ATP-binding protein [Spirochaetia bacterium]